MPPSVDLPGALALTNEVLCPAARGRGLPSDAAGQQREHVTDLDALFQVEHSKLREVPKTAEPATHITPDHAVFTGFSAPPAAHGTRQVEWAGPRLPNAPGHDPRTML